MSESPMMPTLTFGRTTWCACCRLAVRVGMLYESSRSAGRNAVGGWASRIRCGVERLDRVGSRIQCGLRARARSACGPEVIHRGKAGDDTVSSAEGIFGFELLA